MDIEFKEEPLEIKLEHDEAPMFATDDYCESVETASIEYNEANNLSNYSFQSSCTEDNSSLELNPKEPNVVFDPIWICQICRCQLDNQNAFNDHMLSIHDFLVIPDKYPNQNTLTVGCDADTNICKEKQYFCDECILPLENKGEFKNHMLSCHRIVCTEETNGKMICVPLGKSNAQYIHECAICHTHFYGKMNLYNHMKDAHFSNTNNNPRLFIQRERIRFCKLCGKRFYNIMNFLEHIKVIHTSEIDSTNNILNSYNTEKTLQCDICHNIFDTLDLLKAHEHNDHFKCNICKKLCKTLDALTLHKVLHISTQPFYCYICEKKYRNISQLRRHIIRHNGDYFQCKLCKTKYISKQKLKRHKEYHKLGLLSKHKCSVCSKLITLLHLNRHNRIHHT